MKINEEVVRIEVKGRVVTMTLFHTLEGSVKKFLPDYLEKTNKYSTRSLCDYLHSKGIGAMTPWDKKKINKKQNKL